MLKNIQIWLLGAAAILLGYGGIAAAANSVDPQDGSLDLAKVIYDAFAGGHYAYAACVGVILAVALTKKAGARYLGQKASDWLHGDVGGSLLTLIGSAATAMAAGGLAGGGPVTWALLKSSVLVGIGAAGGYTVIKKLIIEPLLKPLEAKLPAWAQPILTAALWLFDKPEAAAQVEAKATAAGQAAVAANPGQGASSSIGTPTEVK